MLFVVSDWTPVRKDVLLSFTEETADEDSIRAERQSTRKALLHANDKESPVVRWRCIVTDC